MLDKIQKIAELAKRGVGGERENAQRILDRICKRYKVSVDDFDKPEKKVYRFGYVDRWQKKLLFQCYWRMSQKTEVSYRVRKRTVGFKLTVGEYLELKALYDYFRGLWNSETERLATAFMYKHRLFSEVDDGKEEEEPKPLSEQDKRAIMSMMLGMDESHFVSTYRMLGEGGKNG